MERKHYCKACSFAKHGVKSRIAIPHTCSNPSGQSIIRKSMYTPTREQLDKYLAKLKELMEPAESLKKEQQNVAQIKEPKK